MIPPPAVPKCRLWAGQVVSPSALCQRAPSQEVMLATNPLGSITPTLYLLGKACAPARSRVVPPGERAPLTSVIIPIGSVFVRKADSSALESYLVRLSGSDEDQGTLRVGLVDISGHTSPTALFSQRCYI